MMMDVDALSRRFGPLIALHCSIANILHGVDIRNRRDVYDENTFIRDNQIKDKIKESGTKITLPVIINYIVDNEKYVPYTENNIITLLPPLIISSCPVLVTSTHHPMNTSNTSKEKLFQMLAIQESLSINFLCIDDIYGSLFEW